jgi:hypothetical protein
MNTYDEKYYQQVLEYYEWINNSEALNQRWERFKKHQAMMHRHLSHVKHELRRQITILTTEELDVLKETIQSEI